MKYILAITFFLFSISSFAENKYESMDKEELCMQLATYYAKGASRHWIQAIKEVRNREYSQECKEIAELRMAATRYAALPSFKIKLDELCGVTPQLHSKEHFLSNDNKDNDKGGVAH